MTTPSDLYLHRKAVDLSLGTSSEAIYNLIQSVILEEKIQGYALDYGAGTGELLNRLHGLNCFSSVAGADIMKPAQSPDGSVEWFEQDLNGPLTCADGVFDLAVAAAVIEHLENPRFMLREIHRVLRPGGVAIVTTPNNESWRSIISLVLRGQHVAFTNTELSYTYHPNA